MTSAEPPPLRAASRPGWRLQYLTLALMWGMSFLFIKEGLRAFAPMQITLGRVAIGAAVLAVVLLARRERLPRGGRTWAHLSVAAMLNNVIPFSLFGYAEQRIGSGLAGICNASAPLFAAVVALAMLPDERLSPRRAARDRLENPVPVRNRRV